MTFATSLLNAALREKDRKNVENITETVSTQQTISTIVEEAEQSETNTEITTQSDIEDISKLIKAFIYSIFNKHRVKQLITFVECSGSNYRWSTAAVLLLLETYKTYKTFEEKFSNGKYSHKKVWKEISAILVKKGHTITGPQCAAKVRSLKKTYKSVKDHNNRSGNDRRTWQFYEVKLNYRYSKKVYSTLLHC